jgi:LysR family transcriptional regulator, low CO2-responsive transcriptional regulator
MLNYTQFRVFYHAAKHLNFTRAAAELYISQPAVTAQMKAFEAYCGFNVFKKKGRKNWITDEGQLLYKYAQELFALEQEIDGAINDMKALKRGVLRIGTTKAYARYFMPLMMSTFHDKYPAIKLELNEGSSLEMSLSLLEFKNEVAIVAKAEDIPEIHFIPFSQEEMTVIVAPDHPLARKGEIDFEELAEEPFIMKDKGSGTRRLVDGMFARCGCTPNILMEVSNAEFIKQLVHRGDGISFLVREAVAEDLATGELAAVPLSGETVYLDVSIAYLKDQHLSPPAKAFLDTLEKLQYGRTLTPQGIGSFMAKILTQKKKKLQDEGIDT